MSKVATRLVSDAEFKRDVDLCNTVLAQRFGRTVMVSRGKPTIWVNGHKIASCDNRDEAQKVLWALTEFAKAL